MGDIKLKIKEYAGDDDHEMYVKLKIEGKIDDVKHFLKSYVSGKWKKRHLKNIIGMMKK